jgi:hypothetical protein
MNRATALLLAMAALLAHTLAIHHDEAHLFGVPYDSAHVTYALARNWVYSGDLAWSPGGAGLEVAASPLWVLIAAAAERAYLSVTHFTQVCGIVAALLTVALSARFATNRIAGIIPPLLLVANGGVAAAAASGGELPFVALCLTAAFTAFEHRRRLRFALALALLVAVRPEGVVMLGAFAALGALERVVPRGDGRAPLPPWTLAPALAVLVLLFSIRDGAGASLYGGFLAALCTWDTERVVEGLRYLRDFIVCGVTPALALIPLAALATGRLSGAGARALALALVWTALVALEGGGEAPFGMAMVPALPLVFIAVQQGLLVVLDANVRYVERTIWGVLVLTTGVGALASKFPGDLGPLHIGAPHARWMRAAATPPYGRRPLLGRSALQQEIQLASRMRDLGVFLRDNVGPGHTLLTPWPGALGYLSGSTVLDVFGRTGAPSGTAANPPWAAAPRADLLAAIEQRPEFIVLGGFSEERLRSVDVGIDEALLERDRHDSPERRAALARALRNYELVTLPVESLGSGSVEPFFMLRRRDLEFAPELWITRRGATLRVEMSLGESHEPPRAGHPQLVQLALEAVDDKGRRWSVDPRGQLRELDEALARTELYLVPQGERRTRLMEWRPPQTTDGARVVELRAQLFNPGVRRRHPLAPASKEVVLRFN